MAREGRLRWAVEISRWQPSDREFDFLCSILPPEDATECRKFKFLDDRKRAVLSRLLQRHAAASVLAIPHDSVEIKRTRGRKPYAANPVIEKRGAPNFNYSVSHEGNYVVLAAEGLCICGCDVAAPQALRRRKDQSLDEVLSAFTKQLTPREWAVARPSGASDATIDSNFRKFWSLKEAYVKATGEGLGFDLGKTEFTINGSTATVAVEGVPKHNWIFHIHELGNGHWVSVARGPLSAVVDAWGGFKATFQRPNVPEGEHAAALEASEPPFSLLTVSDLIPANLHAAYEAAGGQII